VGLWESAEVRVNPTGNVEVLSGCLAQGQGHETTYAQLVSQRLGISFDDVEVIQGDTAQVQFGMGTYGSRSAAVGLSAVSVACDKVIDKAKKIAAHMLEVGESDVDFEDGIFAAKGTNKSLAFPEVALEAYMAHHFPTDKIEPGLKETAFYDPVNFTFPAGCHICEVEVDPETGVTKIEKFVAVDDFGTLINPMIVEGQIHGGLTQGIGQAMFEECIYDSESGQLITGSYMDYCLPRADDVPSYNIGMTKTECPSNPLGVKGCGEAGAIGATPAVINAITDALNIDSLQMPATPERVWRAARSNP
jgi:carbon-monoxide dehydrogenase large subunit